MSLLSYPESQDIASVERSFNVCEGCLSSLGDAPLFRSCPSCGCFFVNCCQHANFETVCHRLPTVFTDGACLDNGRNGARSGVGVALGVYPEEQFSAPVCNLNYGVDMKRTSQRAELLAALEGLRIISSSDKPCHAARTMRHEETRDEVDKKFWIIATDSEYVVKGIAEWLPRWKRNGYRNASGNRVANLDLFLLLDEELEKHENERNVSIGFFHVRRELNSIADDLARRGARRDVPP
ncbi:hypothetical protein V5O48_000628 [Marasmius crinis-equi]|uniref:ribonuclease H n=1 Tax=Marasmius crinis-equi TaxID=585013 RepID=A0ABR3G0J6_9AGAR